MIGLALSGGAMKGFAHAGVLEVLDKAGVEVDMISGTSAGSVIGALYVRGVKPKEILGLKKRFSFLKLMHFDLPFNGLSSTKGIKNALKPYLEGVEFKDLSKPLLVVATDLETGKEVIIDKGLVIDAISASVAVPGFINPVKLGDKTLIDGHYSLPVPVTPLKERGAEKVISVDLNYLDPDFGRLNVLNIASRTVEILANNLARFQETNADVVINVPTKGFDLFSIRNAEKLYELGCRAAKKQLKKIKKLVK